MRRRRYLAPLSWIYGGVVGLRNKLFDWEIIPSESFALPVIAVGNITVGGTGKTPLTEYLIRLLKDDYKLAFLSRGYKRKTRGYVLADAGSTARTLGDEPFQVWKKFPDTHVAVDAKRRRGIRRLCEDTTTADTEVVLLDDAYQHRHVTPGLSLLLMDYNRLPYDDAMLPAGSLREPFHQKRRADAVVITKCPANIRPIDYRLIQNRLSLLPYQRLFFTTIRYGALTPYATGEEALSVRTLQSLTPETAILLVTGIAAPQPLIEEMKKHTSNISLLTFPDHHDFTSADLQRICHVWNAIQATDRLIVTTEKDAARLLVLNRASPAGRNPSPIESLKPHLYVLPIEVAFLKDQEKTFNHYIQNYVRKNQRNSRVHS